MECKRLPVDREIIDFSPKIIVLIKNSGLIFSLKHQKNLPIGQVCIKNDFTSNFQFNQYIPHFH